MSVFLRPKYFPQHLITKILHDFGDNDIFVIGFKTADGKKNEHERHF
jgi:hypothetical protein